VSTSSAQLPVISLAPLVSGAGEDAGTASSMARACREFGFFYIIDHGINLALFERLDALCRIFFAQPLEQKMRLRMDLAGRAWRGYFPVGAERTSGIPDQKEGLYFGSELKRDHPKVVAGVPLHGANLFPELDEFRETVLTYLDQMTQLGHSLMRGLALGLDLEAGYFADRSDC
jgi:isopenicillin N synthase-like dioxygenase